MILSRRHEGWECGKTEVVEGKNSGNREKIKGLHREKGYLRERGAGMRDVFLSVML